MRSRLLMTELVLLILLSGVAAAQSVIEGQVLLDEAANHSGTAVVLTPPGPAPVPAGSLPALFLLAGFALLVVARRRRRSVAIVLAGLILAAWSWASIETTSNSTGAYSFSGDFPPGLYRLDFIHSGYASESITLDVTGPGTFTAPRVTLHLQSTATPTSTATAAATRTPTTPPVVTPSHSPGTSTPTREPGATSTPSKTSTNSPSATKTLTPAPTKTTTQTPTSTPTASATSGLIERIIAPPPGVSDLDLTVVTDFTEATRFLYTGPAPVQTGVIDGTIEPYRAAVLRGTVQASGGAPLPGVTISVLDHPELGSTLSRADGGFDLAVNGGGLLTVQYAKAGLLPAQRQVLVPWNGYAWLQDVVLLPYDQNVSPIDLTASGVQVARGSLIADEDGQRRETLLFLPGTAATMELPGGGTQPLQQLSVRLTEYTVGPQGPAAMPAELPATSAYTYAVEMSADEAVAAGAKQVSFNQPVISYVENFLGFPAGASVPLGFYDPAKGHWVPEPSGLVVKILSENAGEAQLDTDGDGQAENAAELQALGIGHEELVKLAELYAPGQSLWRVQVTHFTPHDLNWAMRAIVPETIPSGTVETSGIDPCANCIDGSIIEAENQTLGETLPLHGVPFDLHYRSSRVPGKAANRTLRIQLSRNLVPQSLEQIRLIVWIAGRQFEQSFVPQPDLYYSFTWDGLDANGRELQGRQRVEVHVGYTYPAKYADAQAFGDTPSLTTFELVGTRVTKTLWQRFETTIGGWDARSLGFGGWSVELHHVYDPSTKVVYMGNGTQRSSDREALAIGPFAGGGAGDVGGPATLAALHAPAGAAVAANGTLYISDTGAHRVLAVDRSSGLLSLVAGNGSPGAAGDGGLAIEAQLSSPHALAVGKDLSLYIADTGNHRIRRIDSTGRISTVAGNGTAGFGGDEGPAIEAQLNAPQGVTVAPDGSLYIADTLNHRIRRVRTNGTITTVAGIGTPGDSGDGLSARAAQLDAPEAVAVSLFNELVIADTGNHRIRIVKTGGVISTLAGNGSPGYSGDEGPAAQAVLYSPSGLSVGQNGTIYFADTGNGMVRQIDPSGTIQRAGGKYQPTGERPQRRAPSSSAMIGWRPAVSAVLQEPRAVAPGLESELYVAATGENLVYQITASLPRTRSGELMLPSSDGSVVYVFDPQGRHLRTLDSILGTQLYAFGYDAGGRLVRIEDLDGKVTTIERAETGEALAIVGPYGARTELGYGSDGYLSSLRGPAAQNYSLSYQPGGLLSSLTDPANRQHQFLYDAQGQLEKDIDPAGGFKSLSHQGEGAERTVQVSTAGGKTTGYHVLPGFSGASSRSMTLPSGLVSESFAGSDGVQSTSFPNGMSATSTLQADPRFGLEAPLLGESVLRSPMGREMSSSRSREVVLTDPADLLSVEKQTDRVSVNGKTVTSIFDTGARTISITSPAGRQTTTYLDAKGRPLYTQVPGLIPAVTAYDANGRVQSVTRAERTVAFAYNAQGYLGSVTDPLGRTTSFERDAIGRVLIQHLADGREVHYTYDAGGNVSSITPPSRPQHAFEFNLVDQLERYVAPDVSGLSAPTNRYTYNADKQPLQVLRPDGQSVAFGYDGAGRLETLSFDRGVLAYSYDPNTGTLSSVTAPDGTLSWTYDGSLPLSTTWTGEVSGSISQSWNNDFRVVSQSVNGQDPIALSYDSDGLLVGAGGLTLLHDPNNGLLTGTTLASVSDSLSYDGFGEVTSYVAEAIGVELFSAAYTRDALGRITQKTETAEGVAHTQAYIYDLSGRLTDVLEANQPVAHYTWDENGNRSSLTDSSGTVGATYDAQDRLLTYGALSFTYSANGELESRADGNEVTGYVYDTLGNLVRVNLPDGRRIDYLIDGANRRIGKKVDGVLVQGWLWDGGSIAAELDPNDPNQILSRFVPGGMVRGGVLYRILTDHLGSPRLVVRASDGAVVQRMEFDEWGNVLQDSNPGFQPLGFAGGLWDRDTGLVRFGARDYYPNIGRWITRDPILFAGGDTNIYGYVFGDPVNLTDSSGLVPGVETGALAVSWAALYAEIEGSGAVVASGPAGWAIAGAALVGGGIGYVITPHLPTYAMPEPDFDYVSPTLPGGGGGGTPPVTRTSFADPCPTPDPEAERGIRSLKKRIEEHEQKLRDYMANPDAYDNQGYLRNAPSEEIRQKIIARRIAHLQQEISTFRQNIIKLGGTP